MEKLTKGFVALLAACLVFVGAPRCIPTANLWNQILASIGHGSHAEASAPHRSAHDSAESTLDKAMVMGDHCPHHQTMQAAAASTSSPQTETEAQKKRPNFSQDFMTDGSGCHCQVNAFVNATPVNYQQPKIVHVVMPRAQEIVPPTVKTLSTQVTYVPEGPPPKYPA